MLYGDELFVEELMQEVKSVEAERGIEVIFGSTIGSISKGIQRHSSDYDIRFLYVDKNKNFINRSDLHIEEKIRYRKFNDAKAYDCTAFWEVSAFLNFLQEPYISQGAQYKLVRNVIWSFFSPYQYDPYGICYKILPLLTKVLNVDCETSHHCKILHDCSITRNQSVGLVDYFNLMHAYLSLLWIRKEREIPPLHIMTLMCVADHEIYDHINHYLALNRGVDNNSADSITVEISDTIYGRFTALIAEMQPGTVDILTELKKNELMIEKIIHIIHESLKNKQGFGTYHKISKGEKL